MGNEQKEGRIMSGSVGLNRQESQSVNGLENEIVNRNGSRSIIWLLANRSVSNVGHLF